jgi:hypothetical protein
VQRDTGHRSDEIPDSASSIQANSYLLPQHLLDSIKAVTNSRDVPYQSLIKVWLQDKLHSQDCIAVGKTSANNQQSDFEKLQNPSILTRFIFATFGYDFTFPYTCHSLSSTFDLNLPEENSPDLSDMFVGYYNSCNIHVIMISDN